MRREVRKYPADIQRATERILAFTEGKDVAAYEADALLRSAVERQFEIAGEAIVHYGDIDHRLVWDVVQTRVVRLHAEVGQLLDE